VKQSKRRPIHHCRCATCNTHPYSQIAKQHRAINRVLASLDERNRRRFAGLLVLQFGPRHVLLVSQITGLSRMTIYRGTRELSQLPMRPSAPIRQPGGGRLPVEKNNRRFSPH
jgi:hypothetical protein